MNLRAENSSLSDQNSKLNTEVVNLKEIIRVRDNTIVGLRGVVSYWKQRFNIINKKYNDLLPQYEDAIKQLADCEAHVDALKKDMSMAIQLARGILLPSLTPPLTPQMFQVTSWYHKIPDLGQWLGRYVPGQPFGDGWEPGNTLRETDPVPFARWTHGTSPPDPAGRNFGLADFFMDSVDKWREVGSATPAKPLFQHLALGLREVHGRIYTEAQKVASLVHFLLTRRGCTENESMACHET